MEEVENYEPLINIDKLIEKTRKNKIKWKKTVRSNTFITFIKKYSLSISANQVDSIKEFMASLPINTNEDENYYITIRDNNDDIIDTYSKGNRLPELYFAARDSARKPMANAIEKINEEVELA
ncbi:MAG: hypothetical protein FWE37_08685 [Spirochaetaceae bacterium]|nr:hypothetical protein [Spirochaetaceae bacterium]